MLHDHSHNSDRSGSGTPELSGHNVSSLSPAAGRGQTGGGVVNSSVGLPVLGQPESGKPVQNTSSPRHWKTLEDYENDPEFLARASREFAPGAEWWIDQPSRREFLKTMGASLALAGMTGCTIRQPEEKIIPYITTPEHMIPGKSQFYASAMSLPGGATGLLVEAVDGRPIRVQGNPQHPSSGGAADSFAVASILSLYDPLRTHTVTRNGAISTWTAFEREVGNRVRTIRENRGAGFALLTEEILSPTLQQQVKDFLAANPEAKWYQYNSWQSDAPVQASRLAFGDNYVARYQLSKADVIFAVEADFLSDGPSALRNTKEFAARRVVAADGSANMNRLYMIETVPTITGSKADHWLRMAPSDLVGMLVAVARELGLDVGGEARAKSVIEKHGKWITALAADLKASAGKSAVMVGTSLSAEAQALGHLINQNLGNIGTTVEFVPPAGKIDGVTSGSIAELVEAIDAKKVEALLILGGDPVFTAPRQLKLAEKLQAVPFAVYHGLNKDATAKACTWTTPATHYLEEWSDTRSDDGTAAIVQPVIRPLYEGRSAHEVLSILAGTTQSGYDIVRAYWADKLDQTDPFKWDKTLHDGFVAETAFTPASVTVAGNALAGVREAMNVAAPAVGDFFSIVFKTDPSMFDGRYATNGWLKEVPQPLTKLTWGSAAWIGVNAAKNLGVKTQDVVDIQKGNVTISVPVYVQPGVPENVILLHLGNGRAVEGQEVVGVDVYDLRDPNSPWLTTAKVVPTGRKVVLASTQEHFKMDGRDIVRSGTIEQVQKNPAHPSFMNVGHHGPLAAHGEEETHEHDHDHDHDAGHEVPRNPNASLGANPGVTFYPEWPKEGNQWGMTINLSACTGCNACVISCQSENNVPVVGADQVSRGREMHWLRVDTYYTGELDQPTEAYHQPVACMHCEHAPCEPVCPVGATTHSSEGLNEMTYNRCIGTRYCSNNCPYKVRRFNFLAYNEPVWQLPVLQLAQNPNVTVRSRGVMEKCTYCVQHISAARIKAKMENREVLDGEVTTACQSVCAANAISFGNVADETSAVHKMKQHPLNYGLLTDLNTRPRTSYLAAVRNPNPALVTTEAEGHH